MQLKFEEFKVILLNIEDTELIRKIINKKRKELEIPFFLKLIKKENGKTKTKIILYKKGEKNFEKKFILNKVLQILIDNLVFDFEFKNVKILTSSVINFNSSNFWPRYKIRSDMKFVDDKENYFFLNKNSKEIKKIQQNLLKSNNYYLFDKEIFKTVFRGKRKKLISFLKSIINSRSKNNIIFFSFHRMSIKDFYHFLNLGIFHIICPGLNLKTEKSLIF